MHKKSYVRADDLFPEDEESISILNKRAMLLAKENNQDTEIKNPVVYIKFKIASEEFYGISYEYIKDVKAKLSISKIPCVPEFIAGVINHRGLIISVVDLGKYLNLLLDKPRESYYIIIIENNITTLGFLVDDVIGSFAFDPLLITYSNKLLHSTFKSEFIVGFQEEVTAILNVDLIVSNIQDLLMKQDF